MLPTIGCWAVNTSTKSRQQEQRTHLRGVELVALRRAAPRRAAQQPSRAAHPVRSTRTGLSRRDKHHLHEIELLPGRISSDWPDPMRRRMTFTLWPIPCILLAPTTKSVPDAFLDP